MTKKQEIEAVKSLQAKGYYVLVRDIEAKEFDQKYSVISTWINGQPKYVVVGETGKPQAMQG